MAFRIDYRAACMIGKPGFGTANAIQRKKPLTERLGTALNTARQLKKIEYAGEIARAVEICKLLDQKLDRAIVDGNDLTIRHLAWVLALDADELGKKIYLAISCGQPDSIRSLVKCGGDLKNVPWSYDNLDFSGKDAGCAAVCAMAPLEIFRTLKVMGVNLDDALALATRVGVERNFNERILDDEKETWYLLCHLKICWTKELIEKIHKMGSDVLEIEGGYGHKYLLKKNSSTGMLEIYYDKEMYCLISDLQKLGARNSGKHYFG